MIYHIYIYDLSDASIYSASIQSTKANLCRSSFFLAVAKDPLVRLNQGGQLWEKAVDYDSINITLFLGKLKFIVTVD